MTAPTPAERALLLDLIAAPDTPRAAVSRAACLLRGRQSGDVSDPSALLEALRSDGISVLAGGRGAERRRPIDGEVRTRILTAPLLSSSTTMASRDVAEAADVSQSSVVRTWRRAYDPGHVSTATWTALESVGRARMSGAYVSGRQTLLVLVPMERASSVPRRSGGPDRDSRRRLLALRGALAADLLRDRQPDADLDGFLTTALRPARGARAVVLARAPLDAKQVEILERSDADVHVEVVSAQAWQALVAPLEGVLPSFAEGRLESLLHCLRGWARDPRSALVWLPESGRTEAPARRATLTSSGPTAGDRLLDLANAALQEAILAGDLQSGDRVTASMIARRSHVSRSRAREAIKALAHEGLIILETGASAVVPEPTVEDVTETYAARHALGAIIMQRSLAWTPASIQPVRTALADLRAAARTGDAWMSGEADLSFQDAIAASVAMRRIPQMFVRLRVQLSMFVAIMGLDYSYALDALVEDDQALFAAIIKRDSGMVQRLWDTKMREAAEYMTRQIERRRTR